MSRKRETLIVLAMLAAWPVVSLLCYYLKAAPFVTFFAGAWLGILTTCLGFWLGARDQRRN